MSSSEYQSSRDAARTASSSGTPALTSSAALRSRRRFSSPRSRLGTWVRRSRTMSGEPLDLGTDVERRRPGGEEPAHRAVEQPAELEVERGLRRGGHDVVEGLDLAHVVGQPEDLAADHERAGDLLGGGPASSCGPEGEGDAAPVDHRVDHRVGDDLAAQRVVRPARRRTSRGSAAGSSPPGCARSRGRPGSSSRGCPP